MFDLVSGIDIKYDILSFNAIKVCIPSYKGQKI